MSNFIVNNGTVCAFESEPVMEPELLGKPTHTRDRIERDLQEQSIDEICQKLKDDLLNKDTHMSRISWMTCDSSGVVTAQTYFNDVTIPTPKTFYGNRVEVPINGYIDAVNIFQRLSQQMEIACDITEVGTEGNPVFDMWVGEPLEPNGYTQVIPGENGYTDKQREMMKECRLGMSPWSARYEQ